MNIIGIMGALPEEITNIVNALHNTRQEEYAGVTYYFGSYAKQSVVVCCAGMGKVNAASSAQVLITKYNVGCILFSGIAGNMSCEIGIGDVVIGELLLYHDADHRMLAQSSPNTTNYISDPALIKIAQKACEELGIRFITGRIATGDVFVGDAAVKKDIQTRCQPDCVEMEGAAVAHVCMRNNIPFVVIRAMSDNSDESIEVLGAEEFEVDEYVATSTSIILKMVENIN